MQQALDKLALMNDDKPHFNDYWIFPRNHAPIVLMRDGEKIMVRARYLLRQPGKPATDNQSREHGTLRTSPDEVPDAH